MKCDEIKTNSCIWNKEQYEQKRYLMERPIQTKMSSVNILSLNVNTTFANGGVCYLTTIRCYKFSDWTTTTMIIVVKTQENGFRQQCHNFLKFWETLFHLKVCGIGGFRRWAGDAPPPTHFFSIFLEFSGKISQIIDWHTPRGSNRTNGPDNIFLC